MKNTVVTFKQAKEKGEKLTMLTAYDYSTAKLIDEAGINAILVGDSLGMVVLGYEDTLSVTMEDMIHHSAAVSRGIKDMTAAVVGLKLLDIAFQFLIILSVLCVTGQVTAGFAAVLLLHFLCLLPISWLPAGISSLARLKLPQTGGTIPAAAAAVLLAALSLPLILWLSIRGIRRLFNHEGGNI